MPTISGFRRRGFTPEAIANFADIIGVAKDNSIVDLPLLEMCVREHLNRTAPRVMAVLRPLKVVITNYPEGQVEEFDAVNNPEDPSAGTRKVPFSRELWIERDDFMENPPSKFYRLSPGQGSPPPLRLLHQVRRGRQGRGRQRRRAPLHLRPGDEGRGLAAGRPQGQGDPPLGLGARTPSTPRSASTTRCSRSATRRASPKGVDWKATLNPKSLEVIKGAKLEPALAAAAPESRWQFERMGYFCADRRDSKPGALVFNRTVTLRDEWARIVKAGRDAA